MLRTAGVLALLLACSGGEDDFDPGRPPTPDLSGTWTGVESLQVDGRLTSNQHGTLVLEQQGAELTGTYTRSTWGPAGSVAGRIEGATVTFTFTPADPYCTGTIAWSGTATFGPPASLSMVYDGATSCAGAEAGTAVLTRQP